MKIETTTLGNSDLELCRIAFGCEQLGGYAWGRVEQKEISRAIQAAAALGPCLFDTADCYGLGQSETLLGEALRGRRQRSLISSKFGVRFDTQNKLFYDNSVNWLEAALESSLRRLKTDYIDLYQIHYWDGRAPIAATLDHLERMRVQGKIRYYGICNVDPTLFSSDDNTPGLVSFSYEYSLTSRTLEALIRSGIERGLSLLGYGSLGQGILTGKYGEVLELQENDRRKRKAYVNFHGDHLRHNLAIVDRMREILPHYPKATLPQIAVRWALQTLEKSIAIVGIKSVSQYEDIFAAQDWRLSTEHVEMLNEASCASPMMLK